MIIAETEFLLGTAEGDRNFETVTEILKLHERLKEKQPASTGPMFRPMPNR